MIKNTDTKKIDCPRCDGSGIYAGFGVCYRCNGRKVVTPIPDAAEKVSPFADESEAERDARMADKVGAADWQAVKDYWSR